MLHLMTEILLSYFAGRGKTIQAISPEEAKGIGEDENEEKFGR